MVEVLPVDWMEVSNVGPAEPTKIKAAMSCGSHAHLELRHSVNLQGTNFDWQARARGVSLPTFRMSERLTCQKAQ